jgi:Domain of unknown function (DUF4169)
VAEIINLRQARKGKERLHRETTAAQNRVTFGTSKAVLKQSRTVESLKTARLDSHRLERSDHDPD